MNRLPTAIAVGLLALLGAVTAGAQTNRDAAGATSAFKTTLSDRPFLGTPSVFSFGGDYVNTPWEDLQTSGTFSQPFTLDEMHGMIAEIGYGDTAKEGQWRLAYRRKLMTLDPGWQALADANRGLILSDRRLAVLKASYSLRDWWQVGIAALVENRNGPDNAFDGFPIGLGPGQALGLQLDSSFKF